MKMKMQTGLGVASVDSRRDNEGARERRLYKVVMCRMRLGFWRRFGFDAVFHSFAYGYVCICVCA